MNEKAKWALNDWLCVCVQIFIMQGLLNQWQKAQFEMLIILHLGTEPCEHFRYEL